MLLPIHILFRVQMLRIQSEKHLQNQYSSIDIIITKFILLVKCKILTIIKYIIFLYNIFKSNKIIKSADNYNSVNVTPINQV